MKISKEKFVFDTKNPEAYFIAFSALQNLASDLQEELLNDTNSSESNNRFFFEEIKKKQEDIMSVQKEMHNEAKVTENILASKNEYTDKVSSTHKQFNKSIAFFQEKESTMGLMTEKMEDLVKTISELPD